MTNDSDRIRNSGAPYCYRAWEILLSDDIITPRGYDNHPNHNADSVRARRIRSRMIIRRAKMGDWSEAIRIEMSEEGAGHLPGPTQPTDGQASIIYVGREGDWLLYDVELPAYLQVKPADLRRYGNDPDKVQSLVSKCVEDNLPLLSANVSPAAVEKALVTALHDLSSVLDLVCVECRRRSDGALSICVTYRDYAGAQRMLTCEDRI